jgi:hypothetical protein
MGAALIRQLSEANRVRLATASRPCRWHPEQVNLVDPQVPGTQNVNSSLSSSTKPLLSEAACVGNFYRAKVCAFREQFRDARNGKIKTLVSVKPAQ